MKDDISLVTADENEIKNMIELLSAQHKDAQEKRTT